jgi:ubiquinone/menaquinone biosynthesis C-methylase UbiE
MNASIQKDMLLYFDERAEEYDDIYVGKGPAIQHYGGMYIKDFTQIGESVSKFGGKHLIDIACGTAYWTPFYAPKCDEITCLDQSTNMLSQAQTRIKDQNLKPPNFIHADFFDIDLGTDVFDRAFVSILLSHFSRDQEKTFFERLKQTLQPGGELMVVDSLWSPRRSKYRKQEGVEKRVIKDGRKFKVFKRYLDQRGMARLLQSHGFTINSLYVGDMLLAIRAVGPS